MSATRTGLVIGMLAACAATSANATITFFGDRATFEGTLAASITDSYDNPGYGVGFQILSNAAMSAVLGETDYFTTGFSDWNFHLADDRYCAGCNGSFELSFGTTSLGTSDGVYGVGLDVADNSTSLPYTAFITYGDGSTENVALAPGASFFGVTADQLIASIHFGLPDGGATQNGSFVIDNLTIGSAIPAPAALAMLGLGGLVSIRRRR